MQTYPGLQYTNLSNNKFVYASVANGTNHLRSKVDAALKNANSILVLSLQIKKKRTVFSQNLYKEAEFQLWKGYKYAYS